MTEQTEQLWSDLPAHWDVAQVKNLATVTLGKMLQNTDTGADVLSPYLRAANVQPDGVLDLANVKEMWFSPHEVASLTVEPGDVVVVEGGQGGFGRAAHVSDGLSGWGFQNSINRVRPNRSNDGRYLTYYLIALRASGFLRAYCNVISMPHLTAEKLAALPVPVPPLAEQHAIADYLDRETAKIDTLIEEQQGLIDLLRERRDGVIRDVLKTGLDPTVKMRDSGGALGAVPEHWNMVPTRHLCTITTGSEDSGNATPDGQYPFYVRGRDILRIGTYSFDCEAVMTPGDGQGGTGKVFHYIEGKFEAHQRLYVFKDFVDIVSGLYFHYFLSTFLRPIALAGSNTVTMESLRRPLLAGFLIAVPPTDEQGHITDYLDEQISKIDTLIAETERFIELARERRSALITAAVTGQLDLREEVA